MILIFVLKIKKNNFLFPMFKLELYFNIFYLNLEKLDGNL